MHEWALAEAVISAVSETATKEKLKTVSEVRVKVGELQQIESDIFEFALEQLKKDKSRDAQFIVETEKAELKCRACGHKWLFSETRLDRDPAEAIHFVPEVAHAFVKCPKCGSSDFEFLQGRGVWLKTVKGAK